MFLKSYTMFYLVGLGLFDAGDISLKGLECLKSVDKIYAEFFTSRLFGSSFDEIESQIGKKIEVLVRNEVEEESKFLDEAIDLDVALITGGDPLIATTHSDFLVQCSKKGIDYEVIHGSSILSISSVRLQPFLSLIIISIQNLHMQLLKRTWLWSYIL